ncbi:tryptophan--tRNA ligase [Candidatus Saccharibacteria bacterium]|nr:tryptophan--tRNA ligase [Candidatus Saccharibacteria bacterium]
MKTILTGIRVNSELTMGNFLGALLPMTRLANKYSDDHHVNIFVADLHTIIAEQDGTLQDNLVMLIKMYLAAGLKVNENVHIYRQSYVPATSEMTWILNCVATMGELGRMIQYKEKGRGEDSCNVGIFDYPILMATDILLFDGNYIPVGQDQFQHIELTRDIAQRVNHRFGKDIFTIPEKTSVQAKFMGTDDGIRIRDLVNPEKKMSKSAKAANSKIMMTDDPKAAAKKIMSATTDSFGEIKYDMKERPGISNLLQIEALVNDKPLEEVLNEWEGKTNYGDLKKQVADSVEKMLAEFHEKLNKISNGDVFELMEKGEKYANKKANAKLYELQRAFQLR